MTYGDIARALGAPNAARAVGNACSKNTDPASTPCHRVVGSDGSLRSYAFGGVVKKRALLTAEGVEFNGKNVDLTRSRRHMVF